MTTTADPPPEALGLYQVGDRAGAERLCWEALRAEPLHAGAIYLLGLLALEVGRVDVAILHLHHATILDPDNPTTHQALGEAYRASGRLGPAEASLRAALGLAPDHAPANHALGRIQFDRGEHADAVASFRRSLQSRPEAERVHLNLGRALQAQGNVAEAMDCYAEAIRIRPTYALAHNNLGALLQGEGRHLEASERFREALRLQPDYPEAHFNLGHSTIVLGDPSAAEASYREAIRLRPDYARALHELGRTLVWQGRQDEAIGAFQAALRLQPDLAEANYDLGNVLLSRHELDAALAAFERALAHKPDLLEAYACRVGTRAVLCDWADRDTELARLWELTATSLEAGKLATVAPFHTLMTPWSAERQLAVARSHSDAQSRELEDSRASLAFRHSTTREGRLRIGYLSSDYRDHAVMHLMQGVFGRHDRREFEVFAYAYGPDDGSAYRRRAMRDCDHFRDVDKCSAEEAARQIDEDGIHILVDLTGYTGTARTAIPALRPAPIQVNYLGYSGTMGAPYIDYIIGDRIVTPPGRGETFRETLVLMPHAFMVTDHEQPIADVAARRADEGLPETGVVFASFNNSYKIEPKVFSLWMRILAEVPGSVLWLTRFVPTVMRNLSREAEARGIDPARLVFAGHKPSKAEHLARVGLADLFLDTFVYNAHTTTCDALWAGLPVLTCPGETFASRVAASLLTAVGLPELVVDDPEAYERTAIRLAREPDERAALRRKLQARRTTWPLFDTPRHVRNLERAYRAMWEVYASGRPPETIVVEDPAAVGGETSGSSSPTEMSR